MSPGHQRKWLDMARTRAIEENSIVKLAYTPIDGVRLWAFPDGSTLAVEGRWDEAQTRIEFIAEVTGDGMALEQWELEKGRTNRWVQ